GSVESALRIGKRAIAPHNERAQPSSRRIVHQEHCVLRGIVDQIAGILWVDGIVHQQVDRIDLTRPGTMRGDGLEYLCGARAAAGRDRPRHGRALKWVNNGDGYISRLKRLSAAIG